MNSSGLAILDRSFEWSLLVFLGIFLLLLLWNVAQLRSRRQRISDRYRGDSLDAPPLGLSFGSQARLGQRAVLVAATAGLLTFLTATLAPVPGLDNFVTGNAWRETPLRVTEIKPDRTTDGFSVSGEVWNQTDEPLDGLSLVVRVWGNDDRLLEEVTATPQPAPLPPNSPARFELTYDKNGPFITGYQLAFRDAEGNPVPHVNGFDVR